MARVLSALVLLPIVIGAVWFLPPIATLVMALLAAGLAFVEYTAIAEALGAHVPRAVSGVAVLAACAAAGGGYVPTEVVLMTALITIGALAVGSGQPGPADSPRRGRGDPPGRLHRPAARGARGGARLGGPRSGAAAHGRDHRQRRGAVLHRARLRTAPALAVDQPEEDARRGDRRARLRDGHARARRTVRVPGDRLPDARAGRRDGRRLSGSSAICSSRC